MTRREFLGLLVVGLLLAPTLQNPVERAVPPKEAMFWRRLD